MIVRLLLYLGIGISIVWFVSPEAFSALVSDVLAALAPW